VGAKELDLETIAQPAGLGAATGATLRAPAVEQRDAKRRGDPDAHAAGIEEHVLLELARLRTGLHLGLHQVLSATHFIREVNRERLRSDRSGAAFSLVICELRGDDVHVGKMLRVIADGKRETDLLGQLHGNRFGLLLPETDQSGARQLVQKILQRWDGEGIEISSVQTYPAADWTDLPIDAALPGIALDYIPAAASGSADEKYGLKRWMDFVGAAVAILIFAPVMLVAALAVAVSSKGPIVFRQIRVGKGGKPFVFYKFRSMYSDADDRIHREYVAKLISGNKAEANTGDAAKPFYKMAQDPRITRVGGFLRKSSIDELPQLFNVLKGDMSLVGPRPALPYEVQKYSPWHLRRLLEVKPGITGLWQVEGRSRLSFDEMVRLDLRYIRTCSIGVDVKILFKTVWVVLFRDGAT
jgi:lipopolysaccharide/colanic/teichoic acid biosynthesis glycosyltransferase